MDVQRFAGAGKRRLLEANDDDEDQVGSEINGFEFCRLKRFNAAWQQENITTVDSSSPEDVADDALSYISELLHDQGLDISSYDEPTPVSSQGDFNEFLQSLLTESEGENLFSLPENESVAVPRPDNLNVSAPERLYSGPTLTDVKSALSIYGREEQYLSTSGVFNSSAMLSFSSESSVPSQQWLPTSGPKICHDTFSRGSHRSFSSSINDLFYKRLYRNKSEAKYSLKIKCSGNAIDDGYKWRKYGQKSIKNSPYPRSYYRCTNPRCCAKKQVERSVEDPEMITVTYEGLHLHYSYSQLHLSQQPSYSFFQAGNGIYEKENKRRAPEDKGNNNDGMQSADNSTMVGVHQPQQLQHQEDNYCESFTFGVGAGHCDDFTGHGNGHGAVDGVDVGVVEGTDSGRGNGLLQDIVRFGIRNPMSFSSSSPSSSSSSP